MYFSYNDWDKNLQKYLQLDSKGIPAIPHQILRSLWEQFNLEDTILPKYYADSAMQIQGYIGLFALPNQNRLMHILEKTIFQDWFSYIWDNHTTIRILDYGCGPLTSTVAILAWLDKYFPNSTKPVEFYCLDRQERLVDVGFSLLPNLPKHVTVNKIKNLAHLPHRIHWVVASYVFNEIPSQYYTQTLNTLKTHLELDGTILILDSAKKSVCNSLMRLKSSLSAAWKIMGPCLHQNKCPLLAQNSWCWFKHHAPEFPVWYRNWLLFLRIEKQDLNYFYLWLGSPKYYEKQFRIAKGIVISYSLETNSKRIDFLKKKMPTAFVPMPKHKYLVCSDQGLVEEFYTNQPAYRGFLLYDDDPIFPQSR
jgi:Mitochondrial small ribosomal subunit Rsm22